MNEAAKGQTPPAGARETTAARLAGLAAALREGEGWWRPRPFVDEPRWVASHPAIAAWCESLDEAAVAAIEADAWPDDAPAPLLDWRRRLAELTALPAAGGTWTLSTSSFPAPVAVPERKAQQIAAFVSALADAPRQLPRRVVDWCGGKGHLGRALGARWGVPVTVIDRAPALIAEAEVLARRDGVVLTGVVTDALSDGVRRFDHGALGVGLHACGTLGQRLLERAVAEDAAAVALAPCCLHKVPGLHDTGYRPVSAAGRGRDPGLDHAALRLATADEVIARASLRRGRQRESAFRLGFDRLARAAGREGYTPLGVVPSVWFSDFADFAERVAARDGIALPARWDAAAAEADGWRLARRARALGLVRGLFRRAIEIWVALDRVAWLEEQGLAASVSIFAPRAVTPRNVLIIARR